MKKMVKGAKRWEAEEVKKLAEEEAIKTALSNEYDFIQARMEADRLLALDFKIKKRRFHFGNERNTQTEEQNLKTIQAYIKKVQRFDESFTAVGSTKDERRIKEMNEGVKDPDQKSLKKMVVKETSKKEDTAKVPAKVPAKVDVTEQGTKKRKGGHIKMIAMKSEIRRRNHFISKLDKIHHQRGLSCVHRAPLKTSGHFNYPMELALTLSSQQRSVQFVDTHLLMKKECSVVLLLRCFDELEVDESDFFLGRCEEELSFGLFFHLRM
ncbi:hypothetical protein Tco_0490655 [Tanacetum coccineum]